VLYLKKNKRVHIVEVENKVKEILGKSKVAMSTSEIKRTIPEADRTILRIMTREGVLKQSVHYLHNSEKTFIHPKTREIEKIKGTRYLKYLLNIK
jgi:hypothetical protein